MSPSTTLHRFLTGMEYPATKDDLIREATRDGLDADDLDALHALPQASYAACYHVLSSLRTVDTRTLAAA